MMKPIVPKKHSKRVTSFEEIKEAAVAMSLFMLEYVDPKGKGPSNHIALHHSQLEAENPLDFFVVNPLLTGNADGSKLMVIINPHIIEKSDYRVVAESCMSFPFKTPHLVNRAMKIKVMYDTPTENGETLTTKTEEVSGLMAHVFQHEQEHAHCNHIYNLKLAQKRAEADITPSPDESKSTSWKLPHEAPKSIVQGQRITACKECHIKPRASGSSRCESCSGAKKKAIASQALSQLTSRQQ